METSYVPKQDMSPCVKCEWGISIQRLERVVKSWSQLLCMMQLQNSWGKDTFIFLQLYMCTLGQVGHTIIAWVGILRFIAGLALHCSDKHDFTANHNSEIGGITVCIIKRPISDKKNSQSRARFGGFFESSYYLGYGQLGKLYLKVLTIFGRGLS